MNTEAHPNGGYVTAGEFPSRQAAREPMKAEGRGETHYLARQPIMNAHGRVHAYELLFRAGHETSFRGDHGAATRSVLDQTVMHGLRALASGHTAFINCTRETILEEQVRVLPPQETVLELLETLEPDEELLAACLRLHKGGYRFALDDFAWSESWIPFLPLADYIKVDIEQLDVVARTELMAHLKTCNATTRLIAERIETEEDFHQLQREGFHLFQGYFFARPAIVENRTIPTNRMLHLDLLRSLLDEPLDQQKLSELLKRDPALMLRLFKLVNSPLYGLHNEIHSIQMALRLVGDAVFRRMATLAIAGEMLGNRPPELLQLAFHRARLCELAAHPLGLDATEQYLLGMLSMVPALLNSSMEATVNSLPLPVAIRHALLGASNPERGTLGWIECYEHGEWSQCDEIAARLGMDRRLLAQLYIDALQWAQENMPLETDGVA